MAAPAYLVPVTKERELAPMTPAQDANYFTSQQLQDIGDRFSRELRDVAADIKTDLKEVQKSAYPRELATADKVLAAQIHQDIYNKLTDIQARINETNAKLLETNANLLRLEKDTAHAAKLQGDTIAAQVAAQVASIIQERIMPDEARTAAVTLRVTALEEVNSSNNAKKMVWNQLGKASIIWISVLSGVLAAVGSILTYFWYVHQAHP